MTRTTNMRHLLFSNIGSNRTQSDEVEIQSPGCYDAFSIYQEFGVHCIYRSLEEKRDPLADATYAMDETELAELI